MPPPASEKRRWTNGPSDDDRGGSLIVHVAGAAVTDLVKTTLYVVGWDPSQFEALVTGLLAAQVDHPFPDAPLTLIGVQALFDPAHLIEIEAVAVVDG